MTDQITNASPEEAPPLLPAPSSAVDLADQIVTHELTQLAAQVQAYQLSKRWNNSELLRKFAGLGSTKTYKKILDGDFTEMDLEKQLNNYRAVVSLVEMTAGASDQREDLYDDLTPVTRLRSVLVDVMKEQGDARFLLVLGDSGAGKTCARRKLVEAYGQRILWTEATDVWNDSPMVFLGEVLLAMGEKNPPYSAIIRLRKVAENLRRKRVCLVVDEGQHLGPRILNTIKTVLNQTPGEFVVMAMYSLWKKVEREAYEDVRQLTGNRLAARIQLTLHPTDVLKMLQRRLTWSNEEEAEKAVKALCEQAPRFGNLAFVREVCKQAHEMAAGDPITIQLFSAALAAKGATR